MGGGCPERLTHLMMAPVVPGRNSAPALSWETKEIPHCTLKINIQNESEVNHAN